jgi:hypothetical protein
VCVRCAYTGPLAASNALKDSKENWLRLFAGGWATTYDTVIQRELSECERLLDDLQLPQTCCKSREHGHVVNPYVLLTTEEWEVVNNCTDEPDHAVSGVAQLSTPAHTALGILKALPIDVLVLRWFNYVLKTYTPAEEVRVQRIRDFFAIH